MIHPENNALRPLLQIDGFGPTDHNTTRRGENSSSPEFLQPAGTILNLGKLWEQATIDAPMLLSRLYAQNSPFTSLPMEGRSLLIAQTAFIRVHHLINEGQNPSITDISTAMIREDETSLLGINNTRQLETITTEFFAKHGLAEKVPYGKTFIELLRDPDMVKYIRQEVEVNAFRYIDGDTPFQRAVIDVMDTDFTDIREALHDHQTTAVMPPTQITQDLFGLFRALFSSNERTTMQQEGITSGNVWLLKCDEVKRRLHTGENHHLTPIQRGRLDMVMKVANDNPEMGAREVVQEAANRLNVSNTVVRSDLYDEIKPRLFSNDELRREGIDISVWDLIRENHPAIQETLQEVTEGLTQQRDEMNILEAALRNPGQYVRFQDALMELSSQLTLDADTVFDGLHKGLLSLYRSEEKQPFYNPIVSETIKLLETIGSNESILTTVVYMALHDNESFNIKQLSEAISAAQKRVNGNIENETANQAQGEDLSVDMLENYWLPSLVNANLVVKEFTSSTRHPLYRINKNKQTEVLAMGVPLMTFLWKNEISAKEFFGKNVKTRLAILMETMRLLQQPTDSFPLTRASFTQNAILPIQDPNGIAVYLKNLSRDSFLSYFSTSTYFPYIFAPRGNVADTPRIAPRLIQYRVLGEALYNVFRTANQPLSAEEAYQLLPPTFANISYDEINPIIKEFIDTWKQGDYYLRQARNWGNYRSSITQTNDQARRTLELFNVLCDTQDQRLLADVSILIKQGNALFENPESIRTILNRSTRESSSGPQLQSDVIKLLFSTEEPLTWNEISQGVGRNRYQLRDTIPSLTESNRIQIFSSYPFRKWSLTSREELLQIGRRILQTGIITSTGRVLAYGPEKLNRVLVKNARYREAVNMVRTNIVTLNAIDSETSGPETVYIITQPTVIDPESILGEGLSKSFDRLAQRIQKDPNEIRRIKEANKK